MSKYSAGEKTTRSISTKRTANISTRPIYVHEKDLILKSDPFFGKKTSQNFGFLILYKNGPSDLDQICVKDDPQDFLQNCYNRSLLKLEFRVFCIY